MVFGTLVLSSMEKSTTMVVVLVMIFQGRLHLVGILWSQLTKFFALGTPTKTLDLGQTEVPEEIFTEMLRDMSERFSMEKYNVFENNCNNFTDECATLLLGQGIPKDIVDLPREFLQTPLGQ